jgi:hypothetical protein
MNDENSVDPHFMVHEDQFSQLPRMVEMGKKIRTIVTLGHDWHPDMELDVPDCQSEFGVICWADKNDKVKFPKQHPDIAYQERGEGPVHRWVFIKFRNNTQASFIFGVNRQCPARGL